MRNLATTIILLIVTLFCNGQSLNLVPVDSANFEFIGDSIFDMYSGSPDWMRFDPEWYKDCPCAIENVDGLISYKSASNLIIQNKCLYIYKNSSDYYIIVGQMTKQKNNHGKHIWSYTETKMDNGIAKLLIFMIKEEIIKAEIPKYKLLEIITDGTSHTFGDIENGDFATTPQSYYSDSMVKLIGLSERIIEKYR